MSHLRYVRLLPIGILVLFSSTSTSDESRLWSKKAGPVIQMAAPIPVSRTGQSSRLPNESANSHKESAPISKPVDAMTPVSTKPIYRVAAATSTRGVREVMNEVRGTLQSVATSHVDHTAWWDSQVMAPMREDSTLPVTVNSLLVSALQHSAQIDTYRDAPLIRETVITEADAAFDWMKYAETFWTDTNEPVGNTLTTGGPDRFKDDNWTGATGIRRRNTLGGQFDVSQRIGHQNSNSVFFSPNDQGTARLTLSYTQPLLRGAGRVYNTSLTVLARVDTDVAFEELSRQLQSHLLEVTRAYWGLYLERGNLSQRLRLYERTHDVVENLEARRELDAYRSQRVRASAALSDRRARLLRAEAGVQNAEARIRALVNEPGIGGPGDLEMIPQEPPTAGEIPVDMAIAVASALQRRPEIQQALKRIQAACIRLNMSKNEVLPALNLVVQTHVAGLQGQSDIGQAWADQFSRGAPSYSVGVQYEMPIWNRAPNARLQRSRLEVRQLQNQFRTTSETLKLEVEVAVREVQTSFRELTAKYQAMQGAAEELDYIQTRWQLLTGEDGNASLVLDNLLRAQERVTDAEYELLNAQVTYSLSLMNLKRADGSLLQSEQIGQDRSCECNLPWLHNQKLDPPNLFTDIPGQPVAEYETTP